ncbi:16S rRNA (uracil1498-N3)-methyltransferase [Evansella caseinilytica]|uniref:Ribosomal RNA small subunit methyltransferase E n=1 Tax=Evansella caseinilytica TaxID=1503961 RepID=A0A1H3KHG4_9BACI|nr:16S rRNA (uracil(1498)-N(3))-methyltransferase [Evansella caseinilytica]SDY51489.1 16S rRNA (uracil1498-N3)-methyltransferase [Evansella caseinilytica]
MQRYFLNAEAFQDEDVTITGEAAKHIQRIMRMETGESIICCTEAGSCYVCRLTQITDNGVSAAIVEQETNSVELPVTVTIAHGLPKGDKLELVIQKGTELGAAGFVPFEAERSIVKWDDRKALKKVDRWNKIAREAAEQSQRQALPKVFDVRSFSSLLSEFDKYSCVLAASEEAAKSDEKSQFRLALQQMKHGDSLLMVVGPEGGFSDRELQLMKKRGAVVCGFGPRILRTETAPLYGLAAISYHFELSG